MTQFRSVPGDVDGGQSDGSGHSDADGAEDWDGAAFAQVTAEDLADAGPGEWGLPQADFDELCQTLQGLPPEDAEQEVRAALRSASTEASAANTIGIMLRVFRIARDSALEGYETWDVPVAYCRWLTSMCDQNFVGAVGGETDGRQDFPAVAVASVYAECGRTLALADQLPAARDRLQKALNVFGVMPGAAGAAVRLQTASTCASMARVLRRMGQPSPAQAQYLKALQTYTELPTTDDLAAFIGEYCEVLAEAGADEVSPSMLALLAELAEEKLGSGSEAHLKVLREVADLCAAVGKPGWAGPALATRARLLRQRGSAASSSHGKGARRTDALAHAEVEAAQEEAAQALEAAVAVSLEEGDLERAAGCWEEALHFRELLEVPGSPLLAEMRNSLAALRAAAAAKASGCAGPAGEAREAEGAAEEAEAEAEAAAEQEDDATSTGTPAPSRAPPPRVSLTQSSDLRPAWASAKTRPAVDDGWDS